MILSYRGTIMNGLVLLIVLVVCVTGVLLAVLAQVLQVDISREKEDLFPKIHLSFKKDDKFWDWLSRLSWGNGWLKKGTEEKSEDPGYIERGLFGKAIIRYGEKAPTTYIREVTLVATRDGVDEYCYYNASDTAEIKRQLGFTTKEQKFKKIRASGSWTFSEHDGPLSNLHKVSLPVPRMKRGQQRKIRYISRVYAHYQEILDGADWVTHTTYFRMRTDTEGAFFRFCIPNGKLGDNVRFCFIRESEDTPSFEKEVSVVSDNVVDLGEGRGIGWIHVKERKTIVGWIVNGTLRKGTKYKIRWTTKNTETSSKEATRPKRS